MITGSLRPSRRSGDQAHKVDCLPRCSMKGRRGTRTVARLGACAVARRVVGRLHLVVVQVAAARRVEVCVAPRHGVRAVGGRVKLEEPVPRLGVEQLLTYIRVPRLRRLQSVQSNIFGGQCAMHFYCGRAQETVFRCLRGRQQAQCPGPSSTVEQ